MFMAAAAMLVGCGSKEEAPVEEMTEPEEVAAEEAAE